MIRYRFTFQHQAESAPKEVVLIDLAEAKVRLADPTYASGYEEVNIHNGQLYVEYQGQQLALEVGEYMSLPRVWGFDPLYR